MPSQFDPSALSLVALCCGTIASAVVAFDPRPHGHPPAQPAPALIAPAGASQAMAAAPADRDVGMP